MSDQERLPLPPGYGPLLDELKERIRTAQIRAALSVNCELVLLYWHIGQRILTAQRVQGWGSKVIERLSADLRREFPTMKGFSRSNLLYMRAFAEAWPDEGFIQQAAGQIPWFHSCLILDRLKTPEHRAWYIAQTIACGWSRNVLAISS